MVLTSFYFWILFSLIRFIFALPNDIDVAPEVDLSTKTSKRGRSVISSSLRRLVKTCTTCLKPTSSSLSSSSSALSSLNIPNPFTSIVPFKIQFTLTNAMKELDCQVNVWDTYLPKLRLALKTLRTFAFQFYSQHKLHSTVPSKNVYLFIEKEQTKTETYFHEDVIQELGTILERVKREYQEELRLVQSNSAKDSLKKTIHKLEQITKELELLPIYFQQAQTYLETFFDWNAHARLNRLRVLAFDYPQHQVQFNYKQRTALLSSGFPTLLEDEPNVATLADQWRLASKTERVEFLPDLYYFLQVYSFQWEFYRGLSEYCS